MWRHDLRLWWRHHVVKLEGVWCSECQESRKGPLKVHLTKCDGKITRKHVSILGATTKSEIHLKTLKALWIIYTYKTWILSVCLFVCLSTFFSATKVPASWHFGSRCHLGLVGTWRNPIFEILIFTDSRDPFRVFSNGVYRVFFRKSQPF